MADPMQRTLGIAEDPPGKGEIASRVMKRRIYANGLIAKALWLASKDKVPRGRRALF